MTPIQSWSFRTLSADGMLDGRWSSWKTAPAAFSGRVQVTTDAHKPYLKAVEGAFGIEVDYAQLQKIYGAPSDEEQRRYSPGKCIGCEMKTVLRVSRSRTM